MALEDDPPARCLKALRERRLPDGGFSGLPGGQYRPDATAWASLALAEDDASAELVGAARERLAADQLSDGRVPIRPEHPNAAWPTYLAVLAWRGSRVHRERRERAIQFVLDNTGLHWPVDPGAATEHDTSIRGWPWIVDTHSWVEPTALAILALRATDHGDHDRVREAVRMLLDRMLPHGGWNYGNTRVFGSELPPLLERTGMALSALSGHVERKRVAASIDYLAARLPRVRTPLSLAWGLLGLGAWGERPPPAEGWILETLARQEAAGAYDTSHVALLLLGHRATDGLPHALHFGGSDGR